MPFGASLATLLVVVTGLKVHVLNTSRTYPGLGNLFLLISY